MSSLCLILDVTDAGEWPLKIVGHSNPRHIPIGGRPTVLQVSRETAETEALRLAREHPARTFFVFEAVVGALCVTVPTHITLGGQVVASQKQAALVDLVDDDHLIPF